MGRLENILQKMTVEEKIGQLTQYNGNLFLASSAEITGPMQELGLTDADLNRVGSVLNFASVEEMIAIQNEHLKNDPNQIPVVFMMDVIHGFRTIYPIPLALGCSFNPELAEDCSQMAAKEASASGVQVTFTPMVDYVRDPRWGRVMETCGEDPLLTARLAQAQIRGFHGESYADADHVATCVKHYAGYGGAEAGRDYNIVERSEREMREFFLPAYKACIDAGTPLLMPSFNSMNGIPSIANPWLMKSILKDEWGFNGVVISDYNALGELIPHGIAAGQKDAAKLGFENGCDIEMCSSTYIHHLKELIEEGIFTEAQLDEAVMRVLKLKEDLGLFEDPYHGADQQKADALYLCQEHRNIAKQAAIESACLLKNDGLLPLSCQLQNIAIIGPFADEHAIIGFWSCNGRNEESNTVAEGISNLLPHADVKIARGCSAEWDDLDATGFDAAVAAAKQADAVILCLGEPQNYSGEGNCRTDLGLPGVQMELARRVIAANPKTAVVLFNGRPLVIPELDAIAPAILDVWFPGTEGGNAVAELLFGKANPSGKLAMTFPRSIGQIPIYYNHPNTGRPHWSKDAKHYGYASDYIDCATLPLYSFGHGLSYSNFVYKNMVLSDHQLDGNSSITVSVSILNDSDVAGKETVQLYVRDLVASVVQPVQKLIDFQKIEFAPHEEKLVTFEVTESMLRLWNFENQNVSENGEFDLMVGHADHFAVKDRIILKK